jgi:hypothetical protein
LRQHFVSWCNRTVATGARQARIEARRREARLVGAVGFGAALILPVVLFHRVVSVLAKEPQFDVNYLSGWIPWALLALGLAFLLPVAWSAGMSPDSRWFPRARRAYAGWGVTLYLLGFLLAWQVQRLQAVGLHG